jgi:hypothetical protein
LERVAKDTSASINQTVAASNSVRPYLRDEAISEVLVRECAETSRYVPLVIQRIKESQQAKTFGEQFKVVFTFPKHNLNYNYNNIKTSYSFYV